MVSLLDMNPAVTGNKRLKDTPHHDGYSLSRSRSDVARSLSPIGDPLENKLIASEFRSNASKRTTMKTLIDHEMSKEVEPKHNTPSVVAKLMGLDALPWQQNDSGVHRSQSKLRATMHSEKPLDSWQGDRNVADKQRKPVAKYTEEKEYNDIYEIRMKAQRKKFISDKSPQKSWHIKDIDEKKMALVRQKFVEAKHLVTDEKLRQTKEFQDALEFLSSNQDLLLKCLQEPNSPSTQKLLEVNDYPVTAEGKRITVLKHSILEDDGKITVPGKKNEKHAKISTTVVQAHGRSKSYDDRSSTFLYSDADYPLLTQIVVLKPTIGKAHEIGTATSPDSSSLKTTQGEDYFTETDFTETEACDTLESLEVANEITRQLRNKLVGRQSDETLLSSVFSNRYTGDESSINKSYRVHDGIRNSVFLSPTSRHSWDYINRFSSPFSSSSCSSASLSPESSVCREATKRLSERWAMLHGNSLEQRHVGRSSSTLGEILAQSDATNNMTSEVGYKEEARGSTSFITQAAAKDESMMDSPQSLLRSKSLPVSSSLYGSRLNVELLGPKVGKPDESAEEAKPKSTITFFKGKVSSLFFKKVKKVKKAAPNPSEYESEQSHHVTTLETSELCTGESLGNTLKLVGRKTSEESTHSGLQEQNEGVASSRAVLSVWKSARFNDSYDQPSPISVLETPFGEDDIAALEIGSNIKQEQGATKSLTDQFKSSLIDKSPPIGSICRTLSWKDLCSDTDSTFPTTNSVLPLGPETEEDWFLFVQMLLVDTCINEESRLDTFYTRWHSPDSPLDPKLREKYINLANKDPASEANRRRWRSSRKLMYDCVNAALADIIRCRERETKHRLPEPTSLSSEGHNLKPLTEKVWNRLKEWISYDARCIVMDDGDSNNNLLVRMVVKNEVVGKVWGESMRVEIDQVGKEIEKKLLEELVEDAVVALAGGGAYQPYI